MAKLQFLFILGVINIFALAGRAQQPPPPIAGAPNITWGMTPDQVQQVAPGTMTGQMLMYHLPFTEQHYPAMWQYYFADNRLEYVMIVPRYTHPAAEDWRPEFQRIQVYLQSTYGESVQITPNYLQWTVPNTQAQLLLMQKGWLTRFDNITPNR